MKKAKIFIGMPVYNGETYIKEAIDSLLDQTEPDFSLVISDNHSTDRTPQICQNYAQQDSRVRYIRQDENLGAIGNFTFLLHEAAATASDETQYEYFMWAAADDQWMPTFLEECRRALDLDEEKEFALVVPKALIESRTHPFFSNTRIPTLDFIEAATPRDRVLGYARLPFGSHKDNMVYGLWRRTALLDIHTTLQKALGQSFIGGQMNEFALSKYRGKFLNKTLFRKKYRYLTPGHYLNPYIMPIVRAINFLRGKRQTAEQRAASLAYRKAYLKDMRRVLELTQLSPADINQICAWYKVYLELTD